MASITTSTMGDFGPAESAGSTAVAAAAAAAAPADAPAVTGEVVTGGFDSNRVTKAKASKRNPTKKKGGGGKYTWGTPGIHDVDYDTAVLDDGDPNFDSEDEAGQEVERFVGKSTKHAQVEKSAVPLDEAREAFKAGCRDLLLEYFDAREVGEAAQALQELGERDFHGRFVQQCVELALERKPVDRELASHLLSSLYGIVLAHQYPEGFAACLDRADDLLLDTPDAVDALGKFVARAVHDELLPPSFVQRGLRRYAEPQAAARALAKAEALLADGAGGAAADVWGASSVSVAGLKRQLEQTVREYLTSSQDVAEVARSLRELDTPSFHFQFVKVLGREALDDHEHAERALTAAVRLLRHLHQDCVVSLGDILSGCRCLVDSVADLTKDVSPNVTEPLLRFLRDLAKSGLLPVAFPTAAATAIPKLLQADRQLLREKLKKNEEE